MKRKLLGINEVGRILEKEGFVSSIGECFVQNSNNCFEVASRVAKMFGYAPISKSQLSSFFYDTKSSKLWGSDISVSKSPTSPAYFVLRSPDICGGNVHASFELYGREYNFGPRSQQGFDVDIRVPLFVSV